MRKLVTLLLLAGTAVVLTSGCGTCANTLWWTPEEGGGRVYGGVRAEWKEIVRRCQSPENTSTAKPSQVVKALASTIEPPAMAMAPANWENRPALSGG